MEIPWQMILHHLTAASSYAEEAGLEALQRQIDAVQENAERLSQDNPKPNGESPPNTAS